MHMHIVVTFARGAARGARWTEAEFGEMPLNNGLVVVDNRMSSNQHQLLSPGAAGEAPALRVS
eukprot:SAG31_NODE_3511_length_4177_cov_1.817312_1_plen_63_part_00